ncbi:16S rRNA (guanine(966)-N(2))-methyltransferase RsmD [Metamycoplasma subdolum]|uniref:16S rRNA (Guanine(966)-N(2))-methyltransferase RsmD n=1 Tax=Metamycoplasma subdolum TaxID=92407 RepID=A0A3M0A3F4_9BACT|nr:16S rRNA (guanine(966)-N(2))-methyltransferase RsmD [Metamycoplasma subdolum]RMA78984.1 16S rRNA (guanine(966)-N(2))-methyltransferase RsmD [Metamycoplasma subdolum]WPB50507.1 16S rRNA (guanine(966)-N(2))-methyltransferase RsmD [Metamycoplasma subdolum]
MLRIIAGKYRSRKLIEPSKDTTRPTTDRAREALFSSLQFEIENKTFLDLFAGSGAFCFEALSRGAKSAISVEKNREVFEIIKLNKEMLQEDNLQVFHSDALSFLKNNLDKKFDFIYLDPPYAIVDVLCECLNWITKFEMVNEGKIIVETNLEKLDCRLNNYEVFKIRRYGKIYFHFIAKK